MLQEYLDRLFSAMYGSDLDEGGCKYSKIYAEECKDMVFEFQCWIDCMQDSKLGYLAFDMVVISSVLIYLHDKYVGNGISNMSLNKLYDMSFEIGNRLVKSYVMKD